MWDLSNECGRKVNTKIKKVVFYSSSYLKFLLSTSCLDCLISLVAGFTTAEHEVPVSIPLSGEVLGPFCKKILSSSL